MIVRVFDFVNHVKVMIPVYPEALEKDTKKNGWENIPHFDMEDSLLPPNVNPDGTCGRCKWRVKDNFVIIDDTVTCIHDKMNKLKLELNSSDKTVALNALLELEKIKYD